MTHCTNPTRITLVIYYIAFKTRIRFRKHMKRADPYNVKKAFKSLQTPNQHIFWQHSGPVFVCNGCGKKFKTNNSKKLCHFKPHQRKSFCNFSMWGNGGGEEKDKSVQLQEEGRHPLQSQLEISYLYFLTQKL